jgi:hypothetical protein
MATRFYFRSGKYTYPGTDFPQTNQHPTLTPTSGKIIDTFDECRILSFTKGASATSLLLTSNATTSQQTFYYSRWMTPRLNLGAGIDANTWTCALAGYTDNASANFPVNGTSQTVQIFCYVWRPGVGLVGTIRQGTSTANWGEITAASNRTFGGTFAGSAVGSLLDGDRIIYEMWYQITQSAAAAYGDYFYQEGPTDVSSTSNSLISGDGTSAATWLETPQDFTEYVPPISMSNHSTKNLNTKFIT